MDSLDFGEVVSRFYFHIVQISSVDVNIHISNVFDYKNYVPRAQGKKGREEEL